MDEASDLDRNWTMRAVGPETCRSIMNKMRGRRWMVKLRVVLENWRSSLN
jgi:hypothetical protein